MPYTCKCIYFDNLSMMENEQNIFPACIRNRMNYDQCFIIIGNLILEAISQHLTIDSLAYLKMIIIVTEENNRIQICTPNPNTPNHLSCIFPSMPNQNRLDQITLS